MSLESPISQEFTETLGRALGIPQVVKESIGWVLSSSAGSIKIDSTCKAFMLIATANPQQCMEKGNGGKNLEEKPGKYIACHDFSTSLGPVF